MKALTDAMQTIRDHFDFMFISFAMLIINTAVGYYINQPALILCSLLGLTLIAYEVRLTRTLKDLELRERLDKIVVASIMLPLLYMLFFTHHLTAIYSVLILVYAIGIYLIPRHYLGDKKPSNLWEYLVKFLGSFGHLLFNLEYALLVLI
jgi:uncharacterized membrane protein (DUF4010 family)